MTKSRKTGSDVTLSNLDIYYRVHLKSCASLGISIRSFITKSYTQTHTASLCASLCFLFSLLLTELLEHACIIHLAASRMWGLVKNWTHHSAEQRMGWEEGSEEIQWVEEGKKDGEMFNDGDSVSVDVNTVNNWHYSKRNIILLFFWTGSWTSNLCLPLIRAISALGNWGLPLIS